MIEFHAAIFAGFCILLDALPCSGGLSLGEEGDTNTRYNWR